MKCKMNVILHYMLVWIMKESFHLSERVLQDRDKIPLSDLKACQPQKIFRLCNCQNFLSFSTLSNKSNMIIVTICDQFQNIQFWVPFKNLQFQQQMCQPLLTVVYWKETPCLALFVQNLIKSKTLKQSKKQNL